jgi:hypothetical protein
MARIRLHDSSWVRQSFLTDDGGVRDETGAIIPANDDVRINWRNRTFSTAQLKFTDTTLGGNIAINAPPQFTRNADIKVQGIYSQSKGMGRYYSEAIDDNSRTINMRFGVPQFNSLTSFFTSFYSSDAGHLARTGRAPGGFYLLGKAAGFVVSLMAIPITAMFIVTKWLLQKPSSKFYYSKPTMPLYWNAVTSLVNTIAVNKGVVPRYLGDAKARGEFDDRFPFAQPDMDQYAKLLPGILMEGGGINVYAMATKAQRLTRMAYNTMKAKLAQSEADSFNLSDFLVALADGTEQLFVTPLQTNSFATYLGKWLASSNSKELPKATPPTSGSGATTSTTTSATPTSTADAQAGQSPPSTPDVSSEAIPTTAEQKTGFFDYLNAELDDGAAFVTFRVDAEGPVTESFSNNVGESEIASKINNMSSQSRNTSFNFAGGNVGGGAAGAVLAAATNAVKDTISGALDGLQLSGLASLGGAAFVDIPQHWQSSVAQLPSMQYALTLISPYGNKMSQMINIYVPLCMLLAGVLPLSTGRQSYTSPFLVELYDKGRAQTRLGMIDTMSITRGVSNLGFNREGEAMAIDVAFSIKDMSSVLHMPIVQGFDILNPLNNIFDDDTVFSDYMSVLGSLSLNDVIYTSQRLKLALTRKGQAMDTWFSKAHAAQFVADLGPLKLISAFYEGLPRR